MTDAMKVKEALPSDHTPTPWRAEDDRVVFGSGLLVAECYGGSTKESIANANFIVKCVNSHSPSPAALDPVTVEALKHERNVLQKICARRADIIEALGHPADITLEEIHALLGPSAPSGDNK
jgi:hypothetical protein